MSRFSIGGADDGYAVFSSLTAIAALQAQGIPHARCVVLIEACEESGSPDLPFHVDALAARIGTPSLVVCLDAELECAAPPDGHPNSPSCGHLKLPHLTNL